MVLSVVTFVSLLLIEVLRSLQHTRKVMLARKKLRERRLSTVKALSAAIG